MLTQVEGDGFEIYHITNVLNLEGLENGDNVIVYGSVNGTIVGLPRIMATIIEKLDNLVIESPT